MKILIIESCKVNYGDDRGAVHEESGNVVDAPKDVARQLAQVGRALYVNKADDPNKDGRHTASKEMLDAAQRLATAKKRSADKKPADKQPAEVQPPVVPPVVPPVA